MRVLAFTERERDIVFELVEQKLDEIKDIPSPEKSQLNRILIKLEKENLVV